MRKVRKSSGRVLVSIEGEILVCRSRGQYKGPREERLSSINTYEGHALEQHVPAPPQSTWSRKHFISGTLSLKANAEARGLIRGMKGTICKMSAII